MSTLPRPSDLGQVALRALKEELIPALPADMRYTAAMTVRALDYALAHSDDALSTGQDEAAALVAQLAAAPPADIFDRLETHVTRERAKVAPMMKRTRSND